MYSREVDNRILTLSASGWVYVNTFILYDYETGSLWFPFTGEGNLTCIGGVYADRELERLDFTRASWSDWLRKNPETKFLD